MTEQTKEFPSLYSITGDIKDINIVLVPRHIAAPIVPAPGVDGLLPCPFCASTQSFKSRHFDGAEIFRVGCNVCTASVADCSKDAAIAAWNRRPPQQSAQPVQPVYLDGVNTERLSQALTWMGVAGPVSKESYVSDMALYVNALTSAVMTHKGDTETSSIVQPVQPACYVNGDEFDNMLDDRTATIQPAPCGYRKTPLYRAIAQPVEPKETK